MVPVMPVLRLAALLVFCVAAAGAAFFPPPASFFAVGAECPVEAPEGPEETPSSTQSGSLAENHEETAKHLGGWSFSHPLPIMLAGLSGSGASPLDLSLPPLFPPPPNRA
jgi:hypothetical protein